MIIPAGTQNPLGQRRNALRGVGSPGVFYDQGGRVRTLQGMGNGTPIEDLTLPTGSLGPLVPGIGDLVLPVGAVSAPLMPLPSPPPVQATASWFTQASVIPNVPNWALLGLVGLFAMVALPRTGGGRKRR